MTFCTQYHSPIGPLTLTSDGSSLTGLWMESQNPDLTDAQWQDDLAIFDSARRWLEDYFVGNPREIDFPLSPAGTAFQHRVWDLLLTIPYGQTTTYGALARQLGPNMSAQAVGQAVGRNPIGIIIPCHRVIGAGGKLTGYAGGLDNKKWLLRHESSLRSEQYELCGNSPD